MSAIECGRLDQLTDKIRSTLGGKSNSNLAERLLSVFVRSGQSVELGPALWTQLKKDVPLLEAPQSRNMAEQPTPQNIHFCIAPHTVTYIYMGGSNARMHGLYVTPPDPASAHSYSF